MKYLACSHGKLAEGLANSVNLISGNLYNLDFICAYTDNDFDFEKTYVHYLENSDEKIIVFTDLPGGSVNRIVSKYASDNILVVSGVNLPIVLEIMSRGDKIDQNDIRDILSTPNVVYVNDYYRKESGLDDFLS